ncbi:cyclophilin-like fold protein [uncultured Algoriphagus sp.]|uniref:cyclophilin-like fold protein n=1 Tax=uncultured Algoriphagus sp. TaxID=417365 RepID=UPI0030ED31DD
MKKQFFHSLLCLGLLGLMSFTACKKNDSEIDPIQSPTAMQTTIKITVAEKTFTAELVDNPTTASFLQMLPLTLDMQELNRNEKFFRLEKSLPTQASVPSSIRTGDLLLYGDNTLVLFYKSFNTSYSYTPMGTIKDPAGLEAALGAGNVTVKFEVEN